MSFRKRNAVISASTSSQAAAQNRPGVQLSPGLRPSPLDGRITTSTGTASLDGILAGHAGLPLGSSLLIEEQGTTDFSGNLLKYYAAEGLVQGHQVHVLGLPEAWKHELPAVSTKQEGTSAKATSQADDKMKIAWRYENLTSRHASSNVASGKSRNRTMPLFHIEHGRSCLSNFVCRRRRFQGCVLSRLRLDQETSHVLYPRHAISNSSFQSPESLI